MDEGGSVPSQGRNWNLRNVYLVYNNSMTYVAELEIAIHLHSFKTVLFKNNGLVRFKLSLVYALPDPQIARVHALPYEFIGKTTEKEWSSSFINKQNMSYNTQPLLVKSNRQDYVVEEMCIFRAEIPMDIIEDVEFRCVAELFFSPEMAVSEYNEFESLATYQGRVSRVSKVSDYFCISFDDFKGFRVNGSYSSSIIQFKFLENKTSPFKTFTSYLQAVTYGFLKQETKTFYVFYKRAMEEEINFLRERIERVTTSQPLVRTSSIKKSKIVPVENMKVQLELDRLSTAEFTATNPLIKGLIDALLEDSILMRKEAYQLWRKYLGAILHNSQKFIAEGRTNDQIACKERLKFHVFSHQIKSLDPTESKYENIGEQHLQQAINEKKKFSKEASPLDFPIDNIKYYPVETKAPKLFEEIYYTGKKPTVQPGQRVPSQCLHIFVLVHGFQATRKDMELFRVMLETSVPNCRIMVSCFNQGKTESSIEVLAQSFAYEVLAYLGSLGRSDFRLSFLGHSMGGIIIRAGLQFLSQYYSKFYTYVSLSSPHLGYLVHSSQLVNAGLWYLNKWEKCQSISQLSMTDNPDLTNTFLYKLSKDTNMSHFENVAFVSSYQDSYVSFESARVQKTGRIIDNALKKDRNSQIICEMSHNIINSLQCTKFSRIDVIFDIQENNLDSLIGRTAHVKLLSDKGFVKILVHVFDHIFK